MVRADARSTHPKSSSRPCTQALHIPLGVPNDAPDFDIGLTLTLSRPFAHWPQNEVAPASPGCADATSTGDVAIGTDEMRVRADAERWLLQPRDDVEAGWAKDLPSLGRGNGGPPNRTPELRGLGGRRRSGSRRRRTNRASGRACRAKGVSHRRGRDARRTTIAGELAV